MLKIHIPVSKQLNMSHKNGMKNRTIIQDRGYKYRAIDTSVSCLKSILTLKNILASKSLNI